MAFNVYGFKDNFTEEDIIRTARDEGVRDENGIPFEIITVIALRRFASNSTTTNFTDTVIDARGNDIKVRHGRPGAGRIKWLTGRGGKSFGQLAKIPHNVELLAKNYYAGLWTIKDPIQDAEIKALADSRRADMKPEEVQSEDQRHSLLHKSSYGGSLVNHQGKTEKEIALEVAESELRKKQIALKNKELDLENKEKKITNDMVKNIENGNPGATYTREELIKKTQFELRGIARKGFALSLDKSKTKVEIIESIISKQTKESIKKEPEKATQTITG